MKTQSNPIAIDAVYAASKIPAFAGNPLIEALPPSKTEAEVVEALLSVPAFDATQREWTTADRTLMLGELGSYMLPMPKHLKLLYSLDAMIRKGYVGRAPRTAGHAKVSQELYELQQTGKMPAAPANVAITPQISASLIGVSGMGKTTTVRRFCQQIPPVIFHASTGTYQVPCLHIELPADGANVKGLATAIIAELDHRMPGCNYVQTYATGRLSEERLIHAAAHLMHLHAVGLLIVDEVQNLANSKKKAQVLMSQLVSLCNITRIPILFVGTNKAARVLNVDFRQARRASGEGIAPWDRMGPSDGTGETEWDMFLGHLWQFQWVRKPVELTAELASYMYWACQGVFDIAIKFFTAAQSRAMLDESETITLDLLSAVYREEFQLLHPMLDALRENDLEALADYDDIAPLQWEAEVAAIQAKIKARSSTLYSVRAGDDTFLARVIGSLTAAGVLWEQAQEAAQYVESLGTSMPLHQALPKAWEYLASPTRIRGRKKTAVEKPDATRFDAKPEDYRRAGAHAEASDDRAAEQLAAMGMAPTVEEVFEL